MYEDLIEIQNKLKERVSLIPLNNEIKYIAGCDVSMNRFSQYGFGGFVVLDYKTLEIVDESVSVDKFRIPYIPGLLSFREIPILAKAWKGLRVKPDALIVDGNGILHPRRMGLATHLGILLNIPTIGCAKKLLTGKVIGEYIYSNDKKDILGFAHKSKKCAKPIFISPGHLINLEDSLKIIKKCIIKHKLPEPTRLAHIVVNKYRKSGRMKL